MKLNKKQLDTLGTILGLIAGISGVLVTQNIGDPKVVGAIGSVATALLGYVVQKPALLSPTTEQLEDKKS